MPAYWSGGNRTVFEKSLSSVIRIRVRLVRHQSPRRRVRNTGLHRELSAHHTPAHGPFWRAAHRGSRPASRATSNPTQMRCPLMHGLPKHTFGSIEMRRSSSSCVIDVAPMGSVSLTSCRRTTGSGEQARRHAARGTPDRPRPRTMNDDAIVWRKAQERSRRRAIVCGTGSTVADSAIQRP